MGVPFLHRFRGNPGWSMSNTRGLRETSCEWPVRLVGAQGPQILRFSVMGLSEPAPRSAGVFIYARRNHDGQWQALYIGETANLRNRLSFNEIAADALLSGATDIHVYLTGASTSARRELCERMIRTNRPVLNDPASAAPSSPLATAAKPGSQSSAA